VLNAVPLTATAMNSEIAFSMMVFMAIAPEPGGSGWERDVPADAYKYEAKSNIVTAKYSEIFE
jgi:hypothetical protein